MKRPSALRQRLDAWERFCDRHQLKETGSRRAVAEVFLGTESHLTLEQIVALARKRAPRIGIATVHRTLKLLEEAGLVERHAFDGAPTRFEAVRERAHHDHLICTGCGTIQEWQSEAIEEMQHQIAAELGFELRTHRHELYGLCPTCRARRSVRTSSTPPEPS
jgi:Fur family transcriptional regulator, ferric uptake regulator